MRSCGWCAVIGRGLDFFRGLMAVSHLVRQNADREAENAAMHENLAGRVEALERDVDDLTAQAREFYVGPTRRDRSTS